MTDTINLGLPYIDAAQAQKHVTHNEALRILDTLVQLAVLDRDLATPPGSPSEGQRWLIAASPTGAWLGHTNHVAAWQDGAWQFSAPRVGWLAYVIDEGRLLAWNGTAWTDALSMLTTLQNIVLLGVGTTADSTNPFSAKLNNTLWVAKTVAEGGDGNLRYKMSKESASKTLSLLLQDNFSGRAEIGLTGDDNLHFKVSSDGSSWKEALCIDAASGVATFSASLSLALGIVSAPAYAFTGDTGTGMWSPAASALAWSIAGAEKARLTGTGLGIGMTPARALDVTGTFGATGAATFGSSVNASGLITFTNTTEATALGSASVALSGGLSVAKVIYAGSRLYVGTPSGTYDLAVTKSALGSANWGMIQNTGTDGGVSHADAILELKSDNFANADWLVITGASHIDGVGTGFGFRNQGTGNNTFWLSASGGAAIGSTADPGAGFLTSLNGYKVGSNQVVAGRVTGYAAMTGSPDKATSYATSTVTLAQLAGRVAQLQADLTAHGLIGA